MSDLRKSFFQNMEELAENDKNIIVLVGDLGFSFYEEFQKNYPKQFINCGIAEQNMIGVAAGLAIAGKKSYVYSGVIFLLMRAYEQIRDDVCFNNLNVKLVGTGASQFLGWSHNLTGTENTEDLLKNLPNIQRHYPQNEEELKKIMFNQNNAPEFIKL